MEAKNVQAKKEIKCGTVYLLLHITQERDVDTAESVCMKRRCLDLDCEITEICESAFADPRLNGACNAKGAVRKKEAIKIGDRLNQGLSCPKTCSPRTS